MAPHVRIRCKNNGQQLIVPLGSTLSEVYRLLDIDIDHGPICARVNNKVQGLHYRLYHNKDIEFLGMNTGSGSRHYARTLFLVLCKAVEDLFPGTRVIIDIPVSRGYYVNLKLGRDVTPADVDSIRQRMQQSSTHAYPSCATRCPQRRPYACSRKRRQVKLNC